MNKDMAVKEFFQKVRQHCLSNNMNCKQCCLRIFCYIGPTEITDNMIDEVISYLTLDEQ